MPQNTIQQSPKVISLEKNISVCAIKKIPQQEVEDSVNDGAYYDFNNNSRKVPKCQFKQANFHSTKEKASLRTGKL